VGSDPPHRDRVLTDDERLALYVSIVEGGRGKQQKLLWISLVKTALDTAMRRIQLLNLRWKDIDFEKRRLWVNPAKKEKRGRWLPLSNEVCHYLKLYYEHVPEENRTPPARVFPITGTAHEQAWKRIVTRAKLFETREDETRDYLHFHDLRHTAATSFRSKPIGLTGDENSYMLGHIDKRMTAMYEHVWDQMVEDIRAKLDAADDAWDPSDVSKAWQKATLSDGTEVALLPPANIVSLKLFHSANMHLDFPEEWKLWEKKKQQFAPWQRKEKGLPGSAVG
jgi:integrase